MHACICMCTEEGSVLKDALLCALVSLPLADNHGGGGGGNQGVPRYVEMYTLHGAHCFKQFCPCKSS